MSSGKARRPAVSTGWASPPSWPTDGPETLRTPQGRDIHGGLSPRSHDPLLTQSPAPPHSMSDGRGLKVSSFYSWFGLSGDRPPSRSSPRDHQGHLVRTKDAPVTQEIPRDIGALCQGSGSKTECLHQRCSQHPNHLGNYRSLRSSVSGMGMKTKYIHIFYCIPISQLETGPSW